MRNLADDIGFLLVLTMTFQAILPKNRLDVILEIRGRYRRRIFGCARPRLVHQLRKQGQTHQVCKQQSYHDVHTQAGNRFLCKN